MTIGILGSGHIGGALARLWTRAGHDVLVGSRHPGTLDALAAELRALGKGRVGTDAAAIAHGEVVLDALPHHASMQLEPGALAGKLLVTASNYYPGRDGEIDHGGTSESEALARRLPGTRLVKAFNMMAAAEFERNLDGRDGEALAVLVAGDDPAAVRTVETLVRDAGFAPVVTGDLATGARFQPDTRPYGANATAAEMRALLADTPPPAEREGPGSLAFAAGLGAVAGMRSQLPLAALARVLSGRAGRQPVRALASAPAGVLLPLAALGELVADKLPSTPSRTSPPVLAGRILAGAVAGATAAVLRGESRTPAALVGAAAAVAASFGMEQLRAALGRATGLPDPVVALGEDALAIASAAALARGVTA